MTIIVAVRKIGRIAIGAESLTSFGDKARAEVEAGIQFDKRSGGPFSIHVFRATPPRAQRRTGRK